MIHNQISKFEWSVLTLWREGFDTFDIAEELSVQSHKEFTEAEIYRVLPRIRQRFSMRVIA